MPDLDGRACDCQPTVMVVDDNNFNIIPLQIMFKTEHNLEIMTAENGEIAVQKYREMIEKDCGCPHQIVKLIIMDIGMPVMNGIEATEAIKALMRQHFGIREPTNIVALTSFSSQGTKRSCLQAGMRDIYFKPITNEQLSSIMDQYFF